MRVLAFSDVHRDLDQARRLAERAREVDVVAAADLRRCTVAWRRSSTCW
jgi:hypothetical protein